MGLQSPQQLGAENGVSLSERQQFQLEAELKDFVHVLRSDLGNQITPARIPLDQPVPLQHQKRLPYGGAAALQLLGKLRLGEKGIGGQAPVDDLLV